MTKVRVRFLLASMLVGLTAWSACVQFTVSGDDTPATGDSGPDAPSTTSSSSSGVSSSGSSGSAIPKFRPSFEGNADAGTGVAVLNVCPGIGGSAGTLSGAYKTVSGCFDKEQFGEVFDKYCPGVLVQEAAGVVDATLTATGTSVTRTGTFAIAGQLMAPCKEAVGGSCSAMKSVLTALATQNGGGLAFTVECYDNTADSCICQMEVSGPYDETPFTMNAAAGTLSEGSKVLRYGLSPTSLIRVNRTDEGGEVPFENALVLDYLAL